MCYVVHLEMTDFLVMLALLLLLYFIFDNSFHHNYSVIKVFSLMICHCDIL